MRNVLLIIRREFLERVRTQVVRASARCCSRVFMVALIFLPALIKTGGGERTLVLVDQAPPASASRWRRRCRRPRDDKNAIRYTHRARGGPAGAAARAAERAGGEPRRSTGTCGLGRTWCRPARWRTAPATSPRCRWWRTSSEAVTAAVQQERLRGQRAHGGAGGAAGARRGRAGGAHHAAGARRAATSGATLITAYVHRASCSCS